MCLSCWIILSIAEEKKVDWLVIFWWEQNVDTLVKTETVFIRAQSLKIAEDQQTHTHTHLGWRNRFRTSTYLLSGHALKTQAKLKSSWRELADLLFWNFDVIQIRASLCCIANEDRSETCELFLFQFAWDHCLDVKWIEIDLSRKEKCQLVN
jgi:hypothetical protein